MRNTILVTCLFFLIMPAYAQESPAATDWTDPSPHQVHSVTVAPNIHLEVLDWGGSGEVLVFLAGLSMNAHAFDDFAPRFTDKHRVLGITRRGHGASSWPDSGYALGRLVEDIRVVLDTLGVQRAILAGHSYAGSEIIRLAAENPDRVAGLIYIDAVQDLTQESAVMQAGCPVFGRKWKEAVEEAFQNPETFRRTQRQTSSDGTSQPNASAAAIEQIMTNVAPRDYADVKAPALAVSYVPERMEDIWFGIADPSEACASAAQRLIYGGIAAFAEGMQRGTIVALQNSQHNLHLVSPDELETAMRWWLSKLQNE